MRIGVHEAQRHLDEAGCECVVAHEIVRGFPYAGILLLCPSKGGIVHRRLSAAGDGSRPMSAGPAPKTRDFAWPLCTAPKHPRMDLHIVQQSREIG